MKIGIITLVGDNYGNKFQNYAVEQLLSAYGDVETFKLAEYPREKQDVSVWEKLCPVYIKKVLIYRMMYQYDMLNAQRSVLGNIFYVKKNRRKLLAIKKERHNCFQEFQNKYLHVSEKILSYDNVEDKKWQQQYMCFICGSDQIWNPNYATTTSMAFLEFANTASTIALAPSFGVSVIPSERREKYQTWLNKIDYLSVREKAGQDIIKDLTGRDAEVLIDPTMMLSAVKWRQIAKKPMNIPNKFVLCYFLGRVDSEYRAYIEREAQKVNLPIVELFNIEKPEYYVFDPGEVLYCVDHTEKIYTDSFHGTVFSILFHKPCVIFERNEGGGNMNSRLDTLLEKFQLKQNKYKLKENINVQIDWDAVEVILKNEREKFAMYVKKSVLKK